MAEIQNELHPLAVELDSYEANEFPSPESCIYRVPERLRVHNKLAYEPQIIAIGPYHRENRSLHSSEDDKKRYFKAFLESNQLISSMHLITAVKNIEKEAIAHYHDKIVGGDEFIKMMILDGCFILHLLIKNADDCADKENDPVFYTSWMISSLRRDLILLENQIPYKVLLQLFGCLTPQQTTENPQEKLNKLILKFFGNVLPYSRPQNQEPQVQLSKLVLKFIGTILPYLRPQNQEPQVQRPQNQELQVHVTVGSSTAEASDQVPKHILDFLLTNIPESKSNAGKFPTWEFTRCATDLAEAGINVKNKQDSVGLLDIQFKNGILEIPPFQFAEITDVLLRNMIAFEQCYSKSTHRITSYVLLLDILMNSERDVKILCDEKIIKSFLGGEKEVANLINNMTSGISIKNFVYDGICSDCNEYISKPWPKRRAVLMGEYFRNSWSIIAVLVAGILLIATLLSTIYAMLAYHLPPK